MKYFKKKYQSIIMFAGQEDETFDRKTWQQYLHCSLILFTLLFIVFIFGPVHISRNNNTLLEVIFLCMIILSCAGVSVLLSCFVFLLRRKYKYMESILTGLLLLCFINATIIPFQATILDGRGLVTVSDDIWPVIRNILLLIFFIPISYVFRKNLRFVAVPLLIFCTAFTVYEQSSIKAILQNINESVPVQSREEILQSALTFSTGRNILVIGIDTLQGTVAEKTFLEYPNLLKDFDGFTLFTRAFTSFPFTNYSRPAIQSGNEYSSQDTDNIINELRAAEDSFMTDLKGSGVRINLFGLSLFNKFPTPTIDRFFVGPRYMYGFAAAASVARLIGYWPSNPFFGDIQNHMLNIKLNSIEHYKILNERFTVNSGEDKCLFFWDYTLHRPIAISKDGHASDPARLTLEEAVINETYFGYTQLVRLFETMKTYKVYDNTLIIIVSDHGHTDMTSKEHISFFEDFADGYKRNGNYASSAFYNAVLFIKPPNAQGKAVITHNSAWNGDVRKLVNYYYHNFYYTSPIKVEAAIRAEKPEVKVLFMPRFLSNPLYSSAAHETVSVRSLYDIPKAFGKRSGKVDE